MAVESVPMEDTGMLSSIMSEGKEPEVTREPEPAQEPAKEDRARDDSGRFVKADEKPKVEEPKAEQPTEPAPKEDEAANVPSWRLREVREAREAAERRAEE